MKTNFHKKNFALRLPLIRRQTWTRKWPILAIAWRSLKNLVRLLLSLMCKPDPHWLSKQRVFCSCGWHIWKAMSVKISSLSSVIKHNCVYRLWFFGIYDNRFKFPPREICSDHFLVLMVFKDAQTSCNTFHKLYYFEELDLPNLFA